MSDDQGLKHSEQEKIHLEHEAAKLFMRWYEHDTGKKIRHIWHNQPAKPDVSCALEGKRLDLEIAHLYGSDEEAMAILGRNHLEKAKMVLMDDDQELDRRLLEALNGILMSKAEKYYKSKRVWLVIRNAHPHWNKLDIKRLLGQIEIPAKHPFDAIWMVGDMEGKSGIIRLFPQDCPRINK